MLLPSSIQRAEDLVGLLCASAGPASATEPSTMADRVDLSKFMFHSQTVELQSPRCRGLLFGADVYRRIVGHHRDRSRRERMIDDTLRFKCHEVPHARLRDQPAAP